MLTLTISTIFSYDIWKIITIVAIICNNSQTTIYVCPFTPIKDLEHYHYCFIVYFITDNLPSSPLPSSNAMSPSTKGRHECHNTPGAEPHLSLEALQSHIYPSPISASTPQHPFYTAPTPHHYPAHASQAAGHRGYHPYSPYTAAAYSAAYQRGCFSSRTHEQTAAGAQLYAAACAARFATSHGGLFNGLTDRKQASNYPHNTTNMNGSYTGILQGVTSDVVDTPNVLKSAFNGRYGHNYILINTQECCTVHQSS